MRQARTYLKHLFISAMLSGLLVICINLVVDPYGAYRGSASESNATKPAVYRRVKLAKAYDIRRRRPEAIVLGTSRSHIGFRMSHAGWGVPFERRYNAAFDGATPEEIYRYLEHAQSVHPLRKVLLGLDTWQLSAAPAWTRPDFDGNLLFEPHHPFHNLSVYAHDLALLLSLDTTWESAREVFAREAPEHWLSPDGQRLGPAFFHEADPGFMRSPADYFWAIDKQEILDELNTGEKSTAHSSAHPPSVPTMKRTNLDYIAAIISFCRKNKIDLRIVLTPSHAHLLEITRLLGLWPALEKGKRELVALLARDAEQNGASKPYPLFDFAGYSDITTEAVPPKDSSKEMRFYWDPSHFKEAVGDLVLDRVFSTDKSVSIAGFGYVLNTSTIEQVLADIRRRQAIYERQHSDEVNRIAHIIRDIQQPLKKQQ